MNDFYGRRDHTHCWDKSDEMEDGQHHARHLKCCLCPQKNQTREERDDIEALKYIIRQTFWMARRYAHGRMTGAPGEVRSAYNTLKQSFPDLVPKYDAVLDERRPGDANETGWRENSDYLNDCNE